MIGPRQSITMNWNVILVPIIVMSLLLFNTTYFYINFVERYTCKKHTKIHLHIQILIRTDTHATTRARTPMILAKIQLKCSFFISKCHISRSNSIKPSANFSLFRIYILISFFLYIPFQFFSLNVYPFS